MAKDEYGLTTNQRAFADEYISNKGNGTQAYLKAYPSVKKNETAYASASRLLRNVKVSGYIKERTDEILAEQKMTGDEVIIQLTSFARREVQKSYFKQIDHLTGETTVERTSQFQPDIEEAEKALELLGKWLGKESINNDLIREKLKAEIEKANAEVEKAQKEVEDQEADDDRILFVDSEEEMKRWIEEDDS